MRHLDQYGGFADGRVYFSGVRRQRGAGLGGIFGAIGRHLIPFLSRFILPHAANAVRGIISDAKAKKQPLKESLKEHGQQAFKNVGSELKRAGSEFMNQSGSGKRAKRSINDIPKFKRKPRKPVRLALRNTKVPLLRCLKEKGRLPLRRLFGLKHNCFRNRTMMLVSNPLKPLSITQLHPLAFKTLPWSL